MTEPPGPERAIVRIPKAALRPLAAALEVRTAASFTADDGIVWMYALGTRDEPHVEFALMPGGEEVWLRMSTDRSYVAVWTMAEWDAFVAELPGLTEPEN